MFCKDQQRLFGEEDGHSRRGGLLVFAGNPPITLAGHTGSEPLPRSIIRALLAAGNSAPRNLFHGLQPRWLSPGLDESVGQNQVSLDGVKDQTFPQPGKGQPVFTGGFQ